MTADRLIYQCPEVSAIPPLGPISNALESLLQDYKLAFVYFHHLKSNVALVGLQWLRDQFATLFDHCKYEFCSFLCHEPEWSLILRKLDTNFVSSREYEGVLNKAGNFHLFQEGSLYKKVGVKRLSHLLSEWFNRFFFVWFMSVPHTTENIRQDTKQPRRTTINFPISVKWLFLIYKPRGHCLIR